MPFPLDVPESVLRRRRSQKWVAYPEDVLPLFVAETDVLLAPAIRERLATAVADGDTGYFAEIERLAGVCARYYSGFGFEVPEESVVPVNDVGVGVRESLARTLPAGSAVVYTPPVYMPFGPWIRRVGMSPVAVPLVDHDGEDPRLDLVGIERALAGGARAVLLSHPHNPTGVLHSSAELAELAELAARHDAVVVSDEIWAPLTMTGVRFSSFLAASGTAPEVGLAISSASKAFNLAGLKCAFVVNGNPERFEVRRSALSGAVGHFGALAAEAALTGSLDWLEQMNAALASNLDLMERLMAEHLPRARWRRPDAGFVAWLDLRAYPGLGDDPAAAFLDDGKVALSNGPAFGPQGKGFARVNFACSEDILTEAFTRMGRVAAERG
ncbi:MULTISPECIES: MalY/PatB family protein [unclassified Dietzia]|uniref:MalY/PatB family protein n=1 Tax=unclassified Dietzia TaxID=2617939 RepID=UPI0015FA2A5F|nr:aminotransferase class I/II-fold pyridoxal phosphate-dependent enzyme [Dietzia sp. DQ12-76]MBB1025673.1 aminotransferase class I/II-fold pyridoxal phosphate-dependent enzyme [Dietzia sp. DQ12-76]MBB1026606.1 aminotransferase class I/II-fold pyridoxal phosphate-dependent enzyme [Dietzia sp. DQ11-38-2]